MTGWVRAFQKEAFDRDIGVELERVWSDRILPSSTNVLSNVGDGV